MEVLLATQQTPSEQMPPAVQTVLAVALAVSMVSIILLGWRLSSGRALIRYQPRRSVPWTIMPVLFLLLPTALTLLGNLLPTSGEAAEQSLKPADVLSYAVVAVLVTVAVYFLLAAVFRATPTDLGLPTSIKVLGEDIWLGSFAFVTVVGPLLLLNGALQFLFESETTHPFIEQIVNRKEYSLYAAAAFAAVVQAPLFEETVFRLVLQGWLEKQETLTLTAASQAAPELEGFGEPAETEVRSQTHQRLVPLLSHGWLSIFVSALLFGLAHIGQGVAPITLVLLGAVLGYLYQRTHRIVPCMVLHALFNGFTMLVIWLSMEA